jgi:hypothetical protein
LEATIGIPTIVANPRLLGYQSVTPRTGSVHHIEIPNNSRLPVITKWRKSAVVHENPATNEIPGM